MAHQVGGEPGLFPPGGVEAVFVAQFGAHLRLVDGNPKFDAVAKGLEAKVSVAVKNVGDSRRRPASLVLESLRQVEMIERDHGRHVTGQQVVNHPVVVPHPWKEDWKRVRRPHGLRTNVGFSPFWLTLAVVPSGRRRDQEKDRR